MKIDNWTFHFMGKPFQVPVHFLPSKGHFQATLPEEIALQITGQSYGEHQTDESYPALRRSIKEMLDKREVELTEKEVTTKVIVYSVKLTGSFDYQVGGRKRTFEGPGCRDLGVEIGWRIRLRSKLGDKEPEYRDERGNKDFLSTRDGEEKVMEWSEQRESFFHSMDARLQSIVLQLNQFFNKQSQKKFLAAIDTGGQTALPAPTGQQDGS